jgi:hypothetical protein
MMGNKGRKLNSSVDWSQIHGNGEAFIGFGEFRGNHDRPFSILNAKGLNLQAKQRSILHQVSRAKVSRAQYWLGHTTSRV